MIAEILAAGYKVIYRPHPNEANELNISHKNLMIDKSKDIMWAINQSFTCITNYSSLAYTYPLTSLQKSIVVLKMKKQRVFADTNLHILARNTKQVLKAIKNLRLDKSQLAKNKIKLYRQRQIYNLACSSEFICEFILKHSRKSR